MLVRDASNVRVSVSAVRYVLCQTPDTMLGACLAVMVSRTVCNEPMDGSNKPYTIHV